MSKIQSIIRIHYDGDIVKNHQIPMRILGKSALHIQTAIDRAYLDIKYGGVWKHARMKPEDYVKTEYLVQAPQEGGYILDFFSDIKESIKIAERISSAINQAIKQTGEKLILLREQIEAKKMQITKQLIEPIEFNFFLKNPSKEVIRVYGDRSIAKEIDQVLSTIRSDYAGDSTFELSLTGSSTQSFSFNKFESEKFHEGVSRRNLDVPVIFSGTLEVLDTKNKRGKFKNISNDRTSILHLNDETDLLKVHPFLVNNKEMKFIGCPLIEFGAIEPNSGDVYFLSLIDEE